MEPDSAMARELQDRIVTDPDILSGKPVVEGTRISVEVILELLASGMAVDEVPEEYPGLERDDVLAALAYAARSLRGEEIHRLD